jgi:predicted enzyme related to lactoylglutathione lyase
VAEIWSFRPPKTAEIGEEEEMPRVIHFEIAADDPDRAIDFYQQVFDWKIEKWEGPVEYWLITTGPADEPGIDGGMTRKGEMATGTENTIGVTSVDEFIAKIEAGGGKVVRGKEPVPGVGWLAYCEDTEGNRFGMMEDDPEAK